MIGKSKEWCFDLLINGTSVIKERGDLQSFKYTEYSGNILPTYSITLNIANSTSGILAQLNDSSTVQVKFGRDPGTAQTHNIKVQSTATNVTGGTLVLSIEGVMLANYYTIETYCKVHSEKSSLKQIQETATRMGYWSFETNVADSGDNQKWIQPSVTDKVFIDYIWSHAYIPDSFSDICITGDRKFRYIDLKRAYNGSPKWILVTGEESDGVSSSDLVTSGAGVAGSTSAEFNQWLGYPRANYTHSLDSDEESCFSPRLVAMGSTIKGDIDQNIHMRFGEQFFTSENTNKYYYESNKNQVYNLHAWSVFSLIETVRGAYKPVHCLDVVRYKSGKYNSNQPDLNVYTSGTYIVAKVEHTIADETYEAALELVSSTPIAQTRISK